MSACTGGCIKNWPAFAPSSFVVPSAFSNADFGTMTRADGAMQVNVQGIPPVLLGQGRQTRRLDGSERRQGLVCDRSGRIPPRKCDSPHHFLRSRVGARAAGSDSSFLRDAAHPVRWITGASGSRRQGGAKHELVGRRARRRLSEGMTDSTTLRRRVHEILPDIIELRHALHRIPETHNRELKTCAEIRRRLAGMRLELLPPILETDTVGLLPGATARTLHPPARRHRCASRAGRLGRGMGFRAPGSFPCLRS